MNQLSGCKVGGRRKAKLEELFRKGERVQESRDRESAEVSENSVRIVALAEEFWGA